MEAQNLSKNVYLKTDIGPILKGNVLTIICNSVCSSN